MKTKTKVDFVEVIRPEQPVLVLFTNPQTVKADETLELTWDWEQDAPNQPVMQSVNVVRDEKPLIAEAEMKF